MDQERIWLLIARKFSKEATADELQELNEIFKSHPDVQYAYLLIDELAESTGTGYGVDDSDIEDMRLEGLKQMKLDGGDEATYPWEPVPYNRKRRIKTLAFSTLFLALAGFGCYAWLYKQPLKKIAATEVQRKESEVYVASQTSSIVLQDGTKVWLNRGSKLRCSNVFNIKNREVYLEGEAFFEVTKEAEKPFIVHAGQYMDVKVLGTRFNVKAYPGDPYIETALMTGKIAVSIKQQNENEVVLKPHQKLTFYPNEDKKNTTVVSTDQPDQLRITEVKENPVNKTIAETAWMEDKLAFNDITFEELSYDLERIFHKKITFQDDHIKAYHLTGEFREESIDEILNALQITTPFHYTITDSQIAITR